MHADRRQHAFPDAPCALADSEGELGLAARIHLEALPRRWQVMHKLPSRSGSISPQISQEWRRMSVIGRGSPRTRSRASNPG